jgi:hypothetical protein
MYLFGLEGSGFIISLALTFLVSGAIMFICLQKFRVLENTIIEQGKILQAFIIRMRENNVLSEHHNNNMSNTNTNTNYDSDYNTVGGKSNLIEVSDNDLDNESGNDSDSDSNSDSESDSNSDSASENERNNDRSTLDKTIQLEVNEELNNELVVDLDVKLNNESNDLVNNEFVDLIDLTNNNLVDLTTNNLVDLVNNEDVKIISIEDLQPEQLNSNILNISSSNSESSFDSESDNDSDSEKKNLLNIEGEIQKEIQKGGITKMKVSDLRVLVHQKGLVASMDNANKLNKANLIKLLHVK